MATQTRSMFISESIIDIIKIPTANLIFAHCMLNLVFLIN